MKDSQKLYAISWKAELAGMSYGTFSVTLTQDDRERIYLEYELLLQQRAEEEAARLGNAKKRSQQKKAEAARRDSGD